MAEADYLEKAYRQGYTDCETLNGKMEAALRGILLESSGWKGIVQLAHAFSLIEGMRDMAEAGLRKEE